MVHAREIRIASIGEDASEYLASFLERYHSLHTDLPDAALIFLAEREAIDTVFTLDRKDFSIYRLTNGKALQIIPEAATLVG
jgi:predicted nucleic acid-binding protein